MPLSATPEVLAAAIFMMALAISLGIGGFVMLLGDDKVRKRRLARAAGQPAMVHAVTRTGRGTLRRDQVEGRFKRVELALRRLLPSQASLRARLERTGYTISLTRYFLLCVLTALFASGVVLLLLGLPPVMALAAGVGLGWLIPRMVVGYLAGRRMGQFLQELPDAIDVIVRGLKSGMPVTEMIGTVAKDFEGPVGEEFRRVAASIHIGNAIDEALWETAARIDLPEFNFLAISIGVQRETGGNLTETLRNLSDLLRKRQQMRLKVKALSSEARASAYIVGSLPLIMMALIYFLNPEYITKLFVDSRGQMMLGAAFLSQGLGAAVMAKMVKFKI